jgi:hypothetical protein
MPLLSKRAFLKPLHPPKQRVSAEVSKGNNANDAVTNQANAKDAASDQENVGNSTVYNPLPQSGKGTHKLPSGPTTSNLTVRTHTPNPVSGKRKFTAPRLLGTATTMQAIKKPHVHVDVALEKPKCYTVLYCSRSNKKKKNKSYNDGILLLYPTGNKAVLVNMESKVVAKSRTRATGYAEDDELLGETKF